MLYRSTNVQKIFSQLQRSVDERNRTIQNISMPSTPTTDPRKDHPYQIIYDPQGKTREEAVGPDLSAELIVSS